MDFLVYSRAAGAEPDRQLTEEHWAYLDRFAAGITGRGPTLAEDRKTWTGSLHIVDLPDADAARDFVDREPYNRAGLFGGHLVRRFEDRLGRTMWDFPAGSADPRFLVIVQARPEAGGRAAHAPRDELPAEMRERLIIDGELAEPDGAPVGFALALQAPSRSTVDALFAGGQLDPDRPFEVEIHDWEPGGRR